MNAFHIGNKIRIINNVIDIALFIYLISKCQDTVEDLSSDYNYNINMIRISILV